MTADPSPLFAPSALMCWHATGRLLITLSVVVTNWPVDHASASSALNALYAKQR